MVVSAMLVKRGCALRPDLAVLGCTALPSPCIKEYSS